MGGLRLRIVAVVVALVLPLSGCSAIKDAFTDKDKKAQPTAWDRVLAMRGPNGEVGKDMALAAFAATFGPLPGVEVPRGSREGIYSGTAAARWVTGHWDELSPEQQSAVRSRLFLDDAGQTAGGPASPSTGAKNAPGRPLAAPGKPGPAGSDANQYLTCHPVTDRSITVESRLQEIMGRIAPKMGAAVNKVRIRACVVVESRLTPQQKAMGTELSGLTLGDRSGQDVVCHIDLFPKWSHSTAAEQDFTLAHEMTHCLGYVLTGEELYNKMPEWIEEGFADWSAATYLGYNRPNGKAWMPYLTPNEQGAIPAWTPLVERSYDAMGFWFLLSELGVDLYRSIGKIRDAIAGGDTAAFTAAVGAGAIGNTEEILDSWPSGITRDGRTKEWDVHGIGVPASQWPTKSAGTVSDRSAPVVVPALPFSVGIASVDLKADVVFVNGGNAHGRFGPGSNKDFTLKQAATEKFCTRGAECKCPDDTPGAGTDFTEVPSGAALVAVTGGAEGGEARVTGQSLDDFCGDPKDKTKPGTSDGGGQPGSGSGSGGGCAVPGTLGRSKPLRLPSCGGGSTNGDPHLVTFDNVRYDLQSVGEFTLAASLDDSFLVQSRQTAYPGSTAVSVNTAAAANVAGDKVGIYLTTGQTAKVDVHVNGKTVPVAAGDTKLPKGGLLTRTGDGPAAVYTLTWPDGSRLYAAAIGPYGLKLDVAVADTRKGRLNGLLGDFDGTAANDLDAGGGRTLPLPAPTADVHGTYADHWRVKQEKSLFDYAPGQSTATFTDRNFPRASADSKTVSGRAQAEATCRAAGVTDPQLLESCILDVALTGHSEFAQAAAAQQKFLDSARGTTATGNLPVPAKCVETTTPNGSNSFLFHIGVGMTVKVGGTNALECAGYLHTGSWKHELDFKGTAGQTVRLTHEPGGDCRLQWSLYKDFAFGDSKPLLPKVSVCQDLGTVKLPETTSYIVLVDKPDRSVSGTYGFTLTG